MDLQCKKKMEDFRGMEMEANRGKRNGVVGITGTPGRGRTCGLRVRSPALCPAEPRAHPSNPATVATTLPTRQQPSVNSGFTEVFLSGTLADDATFYNQGEALTILFLTPRSD